MRTVARLSRLAVAAAVALAANLAAAQVLKQVPADAMVVVKVADLAKTSTKIASLSQKLGIAQMLPQMADPMGALQEKSQMKEGLNKDGEFAFVYLNPDVAGGDSEKSILLLVPVSDYKAFLGNFKNVKTEGDVTQATMAEDPEPAFISQWGDYAAIAPLKDVVAKKPEKVLETAGVTAKEVSEKDFVVYANFAQIRAKAIPALAKSRQKIINQIEREMDKAQQNKAAATGAAGGAEANATAPATQAAANPQAKAAVKDLVNQGLNMVQQFLQDTQAATWGLDFADDGLKNSMVVEFAPNSYLGQLASTAKNTDQPLLAGLPSGNYLIYGGVKMDPERVGKIVDDLSGPVIKNLKGAGMDTAALEKYVGAMKQMYTNTQTSNFGWIAPTGALGQEGLFQFVSVATGNSEQIADAMRTAAQSQSGLTKMLGQPEDQSKVTVTANAKTVDGVAFDRVQTTFNFAGNTPQEMQAQQMVTMFYGPDGMNLYLGKADAQHLLMASGASDEVLTKTIAAIKGKEDNLGKLEQVKTVNAQLPQSRLAVFYVPVDQMVATGANYAKQFGMPVNVQLPPNLPPIGATLSTEASAYRIDGYVPAQLVQSLIAAGMQAWMAVQGGQQGGQPGTPGGL